MAAKTTSTSKRTSKRTTSAPPPLAPTPEQIAARAFELYLARGGAHGSHEEDWLRAESELRAS